MQEFEDVFEDEEFDDEDFAEVDALIKYLESLPRAEVSILNPYRVQQMRFSCAIIKKVLREAGSDAAIECKHHEFEPSFGVINIEGISIDIMDIDGFSRACEFASNTEVYPLKANKVRMSLGFHGLLTPIS